jgi:hypothetical protein
MPCLREWLLARYPIKSVFFLAQYQDVSIVRAFLAFTLCRWTCNPKQTHGPYVYVITLHNHWFKGHVIAGHMPKKTPPKGGLF